MRFEIWLMNHYASRWLRFRLSQLGLVLAGVACGARPEPWLAATGGPDDTQAGGTDRSSSVGAGVQLRLGQWHSCALLKTGAAKCWGSNEYGQLGDGTTTGRLTPVIVQSLSGAVEIAAGGDHSCARLGDGTVKCWGHYRTNQLGDGPVWLTPVVVQGLSGAVEIAVGGEHSCARLGDGAVKCWGDNCFGQVGDGTFTVTGPR
jgi:alpha-tubulin suppressor-like RCC1 family protein